MPTYSATCRSRSSAFDPALGFAQIFLHRRLGRSITRVVEFAARPPPPKTPSGIGIDRARTISGSSSPRSRGEMSGRTVSRPPWNCALLAQCRRITVVKRVNAAFFAARDQSKVNEIDGCPLEQPPDFLRTAIYAGGDPGQPTGLGSLTSTSQTRCGPRIRLDFCPKARIAVCVGRLTWSPGDALRARPAMCGALGRASANSGAANQRSPCRAKVLAR
jgi:hypothetical protein